jgi:hypothetical protein
LTTTEFQQILSTIIFERDQNAPAQAEEMLRAAGSDVSARAEFCDPPMYRAVAGPHPALAAKNAQHRATSSHLASNSRLSKPGG